MNEAHNIITNFDGEISTVIGQITTMRATLVAQYKTNERKYARMTSANYAKYLASQTTFECVNWIKGELAKLEALYMCATGTWYPGQHAGGYDVRKLATVIYDAIPAAA